jgi:hypothetical protein
LLNTASAILDWIGLVMEGPWGIVARIIGFIAGAIAMIMSCSSGINFDCILGIIAVGVSSILPVSKVVARIFARTIAKDTLKIIDWVTGVSAGQVDTLSMIKGWGTLLRRIL